MARRQAAALLVLVGGLLLAIGLPLHQTYAVTRPATFADHASALLERPDVQAALADSAVDEIEDAVEDVAPAAAPAVRAVVAPRAATIIGSSAFATVWRSTARRGLAQIVDEDRRVVGFDVADVAGLATRTTGPLPDLVATELRRAGDVRIFGFRRGADAAARTAQVEQASVLGRPLLVGATLALLLALVVSPARRATAVRCGLAVLGVAAFVLVAELLTRTITLSRAAPGSDRDLAAAVWDELLGGLRRDALLLLAAGLVVAVVARLVGRPEPTGRPAYPLG